MYSVKTDRIRVLAVANQRRRPFYWRGSDMRSFGVINLVALLSHHSESPNIAMFIKRFYLQLINQYFKSANFVKPTGDGIFEIEDPMR
jgi:hypothetical protein